VLICNADWMTGAIKAYVQLKINFTDVFKDPTISAISTDVARISWLDHTVNGRESMSHKWFACDESLCDNSFYCCPSTSDLASYNEFGWWSLSRSNGSGVVSLTDPLTVEYSERGVGSYLVAFDDKRNEYATAFTVKFYTNTTLLYTSTITGNTLTSIAVTIPFIENVNKIVLDITGWSSTDKCVKVAEFTTQVTKIYDLSDIVDFNMIEQRDVSTDNSIPQGNIASAELDFSIINVNREFDFNNIDSPLHGLVKNNARVTLQIGQDYLGSIEYVPLFDGYTSGWSTPEDSMTVSASSRDRLDVLRQSKVTNSTVILDQTFYYWYEWVLNNAGLASYEYNIDTTFQDTKYIVPVGWFGAITHKSALEDLSRGCSGVVYQDRFGVIQIKPLTAFSGTSVQTYTRDNYSNKDNQPQFDDIANIVRVSTSPLQLVEDIELYTTSDDSLFEIGATTTSSETIFYNETPSINPVISIDPAVAGLSITSQTDYVWGSVVGITNTGSAKTYKLSAIGDVYQVIGQQVVTKQDQTSIDDNGEQELIWEDSQWLQIKDLATEIATNILASFKNVQNDVQLTLSNTGNPCVELGDKITVTDLYTDTDYNIVETEINFNGGLTINHKGRK